MIGCHKLIDFQLKAELKSTVASTKVAQERSTWCGARRAPPKIARTCRSPPAAHAPTRWRTSRAHVCVRSVLRTHDCVPYCALHSLYIIRKVLLFFSISESFLVWLNDFEWKTYAYSLYNLFINLVSKSCFVCYTVVIIYKFYLVKL